MIGPGPAKHARRYEYDQGPPPDPKPQNPDERPVARLRGVRAEGPDLKDVCLSSVRRTRAAQTSVHLKLMRFSLAALAELFIGSF